MEVTVSPSLCLVAATFLAGQSAGGSTTVVEDQGWTYSQPGTQQSWSYQQTSPPSGGFLSRIGHRIRGLFGSDEQPNSQGWHPVTTSRTWQPAGNAQGWHPVPSSSFTQGAVEESDAAPATVGEPPLAQPAAQPPAAIPVRDVPAIKPVLATTEVPAEARPTQDPARLFGHDESYHNLTGRLEFVITGDQWMLRYAGADDKHGGAVILTTALPMDHFRSGDAVTVRGELLENVDTAAAFGAPLFRAEAINLIAHAQ
jgi:hypothetical protein